MKYFNLRELFPNKKLKKDKEIADFFEEIARETDGKIPKDIGDMLIKENRNPNYVIKIHRCLADQKKDIFNNGLIIKGGTDLNYTTSDYSDSDMSLLLNIRDAHAYKNESGEDAICVITKIPKEYLEYQEGKTKPILFPTRNAAEQSGGMITMQHGVQTILLPEFVLGAVEYSEGKITGFSENENYKDKHTYQPDGLVCPDDVIYNYCEKKGIMETQDPFTHEKKELEHKRINEIIIRENKLKSNSEKNISEESIKEFALRKISKSKFVELIDKFKNIFNKKENSKEKIGEEINDR